MATKKAAKKKVTRKVKPRAVAGCTVEAYGNTWTGCRPPTPAQIERLARAFGAPLPRDLVALFQTVAGGRPAKNYFQSPEIEVSVGRILVLERQGHDLGAIELLEILRAVHGVSKTLVAFATDTGNANYYCIDTANGSVFYWCHDSKSQLRILAPGLNAFVSGLQESPF